MSTLLSKKGDKNVKQFVYSTAAPTACQNLPTPPNGCNAENNGCCKPSNQCLEGQGDCDYNDDCDDHDGDDGDI